jgi:hypothetical protein
MEEIIAYLSENKVFDVTLLIQHIYSKMPGKLNHLRIHYKKYPDDKLVQIFTDNAREYTKWPIYNICRSILFDSVNNKVVSYSHSNIEYLEYEDNKIQLKEDYKFSESHEGTLISVFHHNNKWYYATRRHIDMYCTNQIIYGEKSEFSHGQMFEDALSRYNLTKASFESILNVNYKYNFELVHYQNKFNISYESRFGEKYAKLFLLFTRDENQLVILDDNLLMFNNEILDTNTVMKNLSDDKMTMEGYIFTRENENHLCKIIHPNYFKLMKYNPGYKTKQEQYMYLYKKNLLNEYIDVTNNKIFKVSENNENIELVGMMSCIFTYIGQRMLDIYYTFSNNNMIHRNEEKYAELFNSKKYYVIFHTLGMMKGIHKNKQLNINEMRTYLKYKMEATDMWKLFQEIIMLEDTENLLNKWSNPLVKMFI